MAVGKTFTSDMDPTEDGLALTYVVPAATCDLGCGYCFIRQRREADNAVLRPQDYVRFLEGVSSVYPVRVSGLQGYEPLLPDSWPYTRAILESSAKLGIPTSLVTNGTHLESRVDDLSALGLKDLTVSLDSPSADTHDALRRVRGAFDRTVAGIRAAVRSTVFGHRVVVASVLLPNRREDLDDMPPFLARLGVRYFGVTPLIRVGESACGRIVQQGDSLVRDLELLRERSDPVGVSFVVDDELQQFRHLFDGVNRMMIHRLGSPERLVRLTPSGACSIGLQVLSRVGPNTPVWSPAHEAPASFLMRLGVGLDLLEIRSTALRCALV